MSTSTTTSTTLPPFVPPYYPSYGYGDNNYNASILGAINESDRNLTNEITSSNKDIINISFRHEC